MTTPKIRRCLVQGPPDVRDTCAVNQDVDAGRVLQNFGNEEFALVLLREVGRPGSNLWLTLGKCGQTLEPSGNGEYTRTCLSKRQGYSLTNTTGCSVTIAVFPSRRNRFSKVILVTAASLLSLRHLTLLPFHSLALFGEPVTLQVAGETSGLAAWARLQNSETSRSRMSEYRANASSLLLGRCAVGHSPGAGSYSFRS